MLTTLAKTDVLMLDDWGLAPLSEENRRDLLEIIEDRHDCRATLVTSQLPVEHWHEALGETTQKVSVKPKEDTKVSVEMAKK